MELRYSKGHKDKTHDHILRVASVRLKKAGANGVGIADLMREAGLTHGGFYTHFSSREDLINEAYALAMDQTTGRWEKLTASLPAKEGLIAIIGGYLCEKHRDNPGAGCALPAFAADMGRGDRRTKQSFSSKLEEMITAIEVYLCVLPAGEARQQAIFALSAMMGAIMLARASAGEGLSTEILQAGAKVLTDHLSARLP